MNSCNRLITSLLLWSIYTIMRSSFFINTNPIYSWGDFFPAVKPDSFRTETFTCCTNTLILNICSVYSIPDIVLAVRVFANDPGDLGSIPGRVIPKTQKMVLDASLLNTQHYMVRIKGKVEQSREGVVPSPTRWCSSYRKGSLRVTLDYGRQLYLLLFNTLVSLTFSFSLSSLWLLTGHSKH